MSATSTLAEILAAYNALPPEKQAEIEAMANEAAGDRLWIPNPGPQTAAFLSEADELFYGGQAGGGKTDLICGLALTEHERTLILRRQTSDTTGIVDRLAEILGTRAGLNNSNPKVWRLPGRTIDISGCNLESDKQKHKGKPHDLIDFDEIADFTESQYRFIITWNRSATAGQRSRVVATGNPPTTPEGFWVFKYWGAWLDPTHPHPAKEGELRWYTTIDDRDVECAGSGAVEVNGELVYPRSRTFIRSKLSDNPDLEASGYDSTLAALPAELRAAYRDGAFVASMPDKPFQLIQTAHIDAAMERWREDGGDDIPMSCLSHDVALGGVNPDGNCWSRRHGYWFDVVLKKISKGKKLDPIELAAEDIALLRDNAAVVIDMGGGYGSGVYSHLKMNLPSLKLIGHNGAEASTARSRDKKLKFANKRAEVYWRFREALEPGLGYPIALPPDPELKADLAAITWKLSKTGITIVPKTELIKELGRSPDKGDCVVNGWAYGETGASMEVRAALAREQRQGGQIRQINGHANRKWSRR